MSLPATFTSWLVMLWHQDHAYYFQRLQRAHLRSEPLLFRFFYQRFVQNKESRSCLKALPLAQFAEGEVTLALTSSTQTTTTVQEGKSHRNSPPFPTGFCDFWHEHVALECLEIFIIGEQNFNSFVYQIRARQGMNSNKIPLC